MCLKQNVLIYHTVESHNFDEIIVGHLICQCLPSLSAVFFCVDGYRFTYCICGYCTKSMQTLHNMQLFYQAMCEYNMLHFYDIIVESECVTEYIVVIFIR